MTAEVMFDKWVRKYPQLRLDFVNPNTWWPGETFQQWIIEQIRGYKNAEYGRTGIRMDS